MYKLIIKNKSTKKVRDEITLFDKSTQIKELDQLKTLRLLEPIKDGDLSCIYNYTDKACLDFLKKGSIINLKQKDELSLGESLEPILNANFYALQSAKFLKWLKTSPCLKFKDERTIQIKPHYEVYFEKE